MHIFQPTKKGCAYLGLNPTIPDVYSCEIQPHWCMNIKSWQEGYENPGEAKLAWGASWASQFFRTTSQCLPLPSLSGHSSHGQLQEVSSYKWCRPFRIVHHPMWVLGCISIPLLRVDPDTSGASPWELWPGTWLTGRFGQHAFGCLPTGFSPQNCSGSHIRISKTRKDGSL